MSKPPGTSDLKEKYKAIVATADSLMEKMKSGQTMSERENVQLVQATIAASTAMSLLVRMAATEAERVNKSPLMKDRFKRIISLGHVRPDYKDPKIEHAAEEAAVTQYERALSAYDTRILLLEEQKRLAEQSQQLSEEKAAQLAAAEKEYAEIEKQVQSGIIQSITTGKPLRFGKKGPAA